jgi:hypothetical protein
MLKKMDVENKDLKSFSSNENFKEIQIQRTSQICSPFALPTLSGQWGMLEKMDVKNKTLRGFSLNEKFQRDTNTKDLSNMLFICVTNSVKLLQDA